MSPNLDGLRIIVVDDDEDTRWLIATILELYEAEVVMCDSADRAVQCIIEFDPDVIVSDVMMPEHDGCWLVQEIRHMGRAFARIPVIALTACATGDDRRRFTAAGFQRHISKPFEFEVLVQAISEVVVRR